MSDCLLYNTIKEYSSTKTRFHMPGHSGVALNEINASYDITELEFSDNLLFPNGIIKEAEDNLAAAYEFKHSLMFTQGASSVILTALHALKVDGKAIAVDTIAHRSIYSAAELLSLDIVVFDYNSFASIDLSRIGVIFITSPDYYGFIRDYCNIASIATANNISVILDQSHGGHYHFSTLLPRQPYKDIDVIVNSMHKTLPCLTGAAIALTNNSDIYNKLYYSRTLVHSTSPNYMVMASIDKCRHTMVEQGEHLYSTAVININDFISRLNTNYFIRLNNDDITRLTIACGDAKSFASYMSHSSIYPEMALSSHIVLIVTPYNSERLHLISDIMDNYIINNPHARLNVNTDYSIIRESISRQCKITAAAHDSELVDISKATGRISAANIGLYPPGIPIIRCGEIITNNNIDYITSNNNKIFGIISGKMRVYL